jgi:hypothetical protein
MDPEELLKNWAEEVRACNNKSDVLGDNWLEECYEWYHININSKDRRTSCPIPAANRQIQVGDLIEWIHTGSPISYGLVVSDTKRLSGRGLTPSGWYTQYEILWAASGNISSVGADDIQALAQCTKQADMI